MAMASSPTPGLTELGGKYRILADLGQGGTAMVSLAVARGPSGFSKLVVLKVMKSNLAQEHDFAKMFMNEARLAARLNHPNIVQTNEVFEHHGLPVIVMEYLEGQALSGILARARATQKFPLAMHLRVISDMLGGLHYSHELADFDGTPLNVVHRDMSPHNVFVTFDGQVKLLDFGIAKLAGSHVETATGVIKGKIRYMSPEQITGESVDRRADIFAVGVMLWEAVTDARMWSGMSEATIMNHLLNGELPSPREVNSHLDQQLERIVMKALAPDPAERYATAAELQADIDEYVAGLGTQARPRDIGKVVSDMFGDVRSQTKGIIETQLSKVVSLSDAEYAAAHPIELTNLALSQSGSTQLENGLRASNRPRSTVPFVAIGLLVVGAIAGAWLVTSNGKSEAAGPSSAASTALSTAQLRVTAFPATAKIFLDGQLLPSNPFAQAMPRDTKKHTLRFEAAGHEIAEREISLENDNDLVVVLEQSAKPAPAPTSAPPPPRKTEGAAPNTKTPIRVAPPRKTGNCDPPFTVDERGVKRYKPDCL